MAWRRWRKSLLRARRRSARSPAACAPSARARYDEIVDSQGLLRSALIARLAHGRRHGYDAASIREPLAAMFYDVRHRVSRDLHAVERNRILTGLALGYAPQGAPDFGLDRARFARRRRALRRAAARHRAAGKAMAGGELDRARPGARRATASIWCCRGAPRPSARAASASPPRCRARACRERAPLDEVARLIAGAQFVVGVDTGLLHLAAALGVPLVAIFAGSEPGLTGPVGSGPIAVLGRQGAPPSVSEVHEALQRIAR